MKNEKVKQEIQEYKQSTSHSAMKTKEPVFSSFSTLPSQILDWIEYNNSGVILLWDIKGKAVFVSNTVTRIFGYEKSELNDAYWYDFISCEDVNYIKEKFKNDESNTLNFKVHLLNKNQKYILTEVSVAKIYDETSYQSYFVSSLNDISEKKGIEELMIRSEKMSIAGQLAAGVAHEVRNPLTSIKGFLQLLQAGINRNEEYYNIMIDEIEKIETITTELLYISKPITENRKMESLKDMIEDVVALLQSQASLKNINIDVSQSINEYISCDRSQIKQVLINLIKNAIEAMDNEGKICIQVQSDESYVKVNIIDEGKGVPEDVIHKLGEPFFTTKKNGTGLGLMITKQLLERHNASLNIERNKEKGSTFQMVFPNIQ